MWEIAASNAINEWGWYCVLCSSLLLHFGKLFLANNMTGFLVKVVIIVIDQRPLLFIEWTNTIQHVWYNVEGVWSGVVALCQKKVIIIKKKSVTKKLFVTAGSILMPMRENTWKVFEAAFLFWGSLPFHVKRWSLTEPSKNILRSMCIEIDTYYTYVVQTSSTYKAYM